MLIAEAKKDPGGIDDDDDKTAVYIRKLQPCRDAGGQYWLV